MPKYYTYNNQKYSTCFPLEWAINHFEQTGPKECEGCFEYGCDDSIFKQYCMDCQVYEYMGSRVTDEYCHAASRQPTHTAEVHNYFYTSDISDISDGEETWVDNHYFNMDGNAEYKSSVNMAMNETTTPGDDTSYHEPYSRSGRVFAAVTPILYKYPATVSIDTDYMIDIDENIEPMNCSQFRPLSTKK